MHKIIKTAPTMSFAGHVKVAYKYYIQIFLTPLVPSINNGLLLDMVDQNLSRNK